MAIMIKSPAEIEKMRYSGKLLREVHDTIAPYVVEGATTMDLEKIAQAKIDQLKAIAAFKGYHGFPAALCTSINEQVVHGMPSDKRPLKNGDILSIDCGLIVNGFYSDAAVTYAIGTPTPKIAKLLEVTKASLEAAIEAAQVGGRLFDIGFCGAGDVRGRRLWRREGVCWPRDRQADARRSSGSELRLKGERPKAEGGHGAGD